MCAFTDNCIECKELIDILFDKKFIKDGEHYPDTKVLLVKGGTKEGIEIGLSKYCSEEYAKVILEWHKSKIKEDRLNQLQRHQNMSTLKLTNTAYWYTERNKILREE